MSALIGFLSLPGILVGLISLAAPLRFLGIQSRQMAAMVVAICSATLLAAVALDNRADGSAKDANAAAQQAPASPIVDNGCQLAGAVPNCEEEVAKLVAAQAANLLAFAHPASPPARQTSEPYPDRPTEADRMNEMKAIRASANVRAYADQRNRDAAQYQAERAYDRSERSDIESDEARRQYKLKQDSLAYSQRIRERESLRKRRGY
jgi:hypothetical protein